MELLAPNCPKLVYRLQTANLTVLGSKILFHIKLHKILPKASRYFQNFDDFSQILECLFPENWKKKKKCTPYGAILDMKVPSKSCLKILFLGALKFKYVQTRFAKFRNRTLSEILLLRAFRLPRNQSFSIFV